MLKVIEIITVILGIVALILPALMGLEAPMPMKLVILYIVTGLMIDLSDRKG